MSATDELRRLLDDRGTHWWAGADEHKTLWESNSLTWEYFNDENGDAWLGFLGACEQDITPEQAIAATLVVGERTCRMESVWGTNALQCNECCSYVSTWDAECEIGKINFCPTCGAKVVTE